MILLTEDAYLRLGRQAVEAQPREACGILAGETAEGHDLDVVKDDDVVAGVRSIDYPPPDAPVRDRVRRVDRIFPCENADDKPEWRYTIDPGDQMAAFEAIDEAGLDLIGFYHSHPRGPRKPSETDLDRASWPDHSYLIVSLDGDEPWVGAWRYTEEGTFEDERIVVMD